MRAKRARLPPAGPALSRSMRAQVLSSMSAGFPVSAPVGLNVAPRASRPPNRLSIPYTDRPPSVKCVGAVPDSPSRHRPAIASTTWSEAARPNRALGIGSVFSIVPTAR